MQKDTTHNTMPDFGNFYDNYSAFSIALYDDDTAVVGVAHSVPPTGMRRTKILGHLRVHLRSVGCQIGPEALLDFVQEVIRQDKPYMQS